MSSEQNQQMFLALAALLGVALLLRAGPLYWSQYPSTLDGFGYAANAQKTIDSGSLQLTGARADNLFFTMVLVIPSLVFDATALRVTQPAATVIGTSICLVGVVIARRAIKKSRLNVSVPSVTLAATGLLAVEGIFLRRTTVPDSDLVGILFVLLVAVSLQYAYQTGYPRWYGITALLLLTFPILHTLTSLVAALVITGITARYISSRLTLRSFLGGLTVAGGFWAYIVVYYHTAETSLSLFVPYIDRVTAYPGLFVAWIIVLVIGMVWLQYTNVRLRQLIFFGAIGLFFSMAGINALTPVYPGTANTPQIVLVLVVLLGFISLSAALSLDIIGDRDGGTVLLALFLAPSVIIGFSLTASLTGEYYSTALRTQTFLHFPIIAIGSVTIARLLTSNDVGGMHRAFRIAAAVVVVTATVTTVPLAFINLDTGSKYSTTLDSEYESVAFVSAEYPHAWTTDDSLGRVGANLDARVSTSPAASWLAGGPPPDCAVLSQESWATTGAHLFPSSPEAIDPDIYAEWRSSRNVIYTSSGLDPIAVSVPRTNATMC
jgi:hypothetical protein